MKIQLNNQNFNSIIERFHFKFKQVRKFNAPNPNKFINHLNDIHLVDSYIYSCTYSNNKNIKKNNLIIKFELNNELFSLNILLEDYSDLLVD